LAGPGGRPTGGGIPAPAGNGFDEPIGPIDFPMPEITNCADPPSTPESVRCCRSKASGDR
jgi:hypothetical protein